MSYPINYPTPQGADVQIFYGQTRTGSTASSVEWTKPQGASFVWFTLIGAGGLNDEFGAGGSGAVTNCLMPAFLIPDVLQVRVGNPRAGSAAGTAILYQQKAGTPYSLLTANNGGPQAGGQASTATPFAAAGIYQSIAGTLATAGSLTTFLSGGTAVPGEAVLANYGYSTTSNQSGFFQMQPIIVGVAGAYGDLGTTYSGIGCGASALNSVPGNGLVVIISW